jgi:hypothetical protein
MRSFALLLLAVLLCLPGLTEAQPFGYVIDSDGLTTADDLYRVDLATGALTLIGPVSPAVGAKHADVEGLALSPEGVLYGADDALDALIRIDVSSGLASLVGPLGTAGLGPAGNLDYGLAFTCDGRLWLSSDTTNTLWQVDPGSGAASAPRDLPAGITGLAGRGSSLFGLGLDGNLYRYSPASGVSQQIGAHGIPAFDDGGLDFDGTGRLWAIAEFTPSNPSLPSSIYRIDVDTGVATFVADTRTGIEGLAIAPSACIAGEDAQPVPGPGVPGLLLLAGLLGCVASWRLARS